MKDRFHRNKIVSLTDEDGNVLTQPYDIQQEILAFYKALLGSETTGLQQVDHQILHLGPCLPEDVKFDLVKPVTSDEIDDALKMIDDSKAPGLDGFNAYFFKKAWSTVKHEVYSAVYGFWTSAASME